MLNRAALLTICGLWFVCAGSAVAQTWNQVWSDEFDGARGTPIDAAKWKFESGILKVNNEVEYYCVPDSTAGGCEAAKPNAYIDGNGHLMIQAIKLNPSTAPNSGSWTSARMTTQGTEEFQYGRAEARMMLPVGPGIWPVLGSGDDYQFRGVAHLRGDRLHGKRARLGRTWAREDQLNAARVGLFRR